MRKGNLQNFLENTGGNVEAPIPESEPDSVELKPKTKRSKTRQDKKMASVFMDVSVFKQLQILKIETGLSIQELLIKAPNLLFQAYNKPPIAK